MSSRAWPGREGEAEAGAGGGGEGRRAQPGWGPTAAAVAAAEKGSGGRSRFIQSESRSQRAGAGSAARAPAPARPARDKGLLFRASARGRPRRSCCGINQLRRELAPNKAPRGRGGGRGGEEPGRERRVGGGVRSQPSAENGQSRPGKGRGSEPQGLRVAELCPHRNFSGISSPHSHDHRLPQASSPILLPEPLQSAEPDSPPWLSGRPSADPDVLTDQEQFPTEGGSDRCQRSLAASNHTKCPCSPALRVLA
ncbi:translation initiation factor IF-2-like [Dromiciops gliroides]|uniref:translation initiation factor IF-2-like n=1 Tax=Dromiciops gliroides TaxID=33562 RepID=UPI001CC75704|nr:translation initiation factor IF-2-like [Dromiciops gliroides]